MTPAARRKIAYLICAVIALGGLGFALHNWETMDPAQMVETLRGYGAWAAVLIVVLMVLHSFVPLPAEVLALAAGAVFGTIAGAVIIWIGAMLGAVLSYWLARRFGEGWVRSLLSPKQVSKLDSWSDRTSPMALLVARFIPLIAFNLINYAAGLARVPFATFLWTTAVGIVPLVLLSTYLGAEMRTMSWAMLLTVSGVCIAAVVVFWAVKRVTGHRNV